LSARIPLPEILLGACSLGLLHHWDADGISSAAKIIGWARETGIGVVNAVPEIGDYSCLDAGIRKLRVQGPDVILGLDLSSTQEGMTRIAEASGQVPVVWIDHHSLPPRTTPEIVSYHPETSCTHGVFSNSRFLEILMGEKIGLMGAIGNCGDLGSKIFSHQARAETEISARTNGLNLGQLIEITDLLDSNYRFGRTADVLEAPWILSRAECHPETLLGVKRWMANRKAVKREISRLIKSPLQPARKVVLREIETPMHLTSIITRKTALQVRGKSSAVVVRNMGMDPQPIYTRVTTPGTDLTPLIKEARSRGFSAGGKPDVVGMMVPAGEVEKTIGLIIDFLEER